MEGGVYLLYGGVTRGLYGLVCGLRCRSGFVRVREGRRVSSRDGRNRDLGLGVGARQACYCWHSIRASNRTREALGLPRRAEQRSKLAKAKIILGRSAVSPLLL